MVTFFFLAIPAVLFTLLLSLSIISMLRYVLREARMVAGGACVAMRLEDDRIVLIDHKGEESSGKLQSGSLISLYLAVLHVEVPGQGVRNVLVLPDSLGAESFRHLRILLRWTTGLRA
jgi:hypothetical protein